MKSYFFGKLSEINYRIAIHEGNANRRLASESIKIRLLPTSEVPKVYKKEFEKFIHLVTETIKKHNVPGAIPSKIGNIRNQTATKYIKLLIDIEIYIRNE